MDEFDQLIKSNSPDAQQLALELREFLTRLVPQAREKIYPGWGVADFQLAGRRDFLSIGPQKNYVNLYFMRGSELQDPAGLLQGSGKNMRHVKIRTRADLQNGALKALIEAAAGL